MVNKAIAVKAVPTVSSLPWRTYVRKESTLTKIGAVDQTDWNITELNRPDKKLDQDGLRTRNRDILFTSHLSSLARCSRVRAIHRSSQAKNLMNLRPVNTSLTTPILLSRAARTPFWIRIARRARKLLSGQMRIRTPKPANADQPRS